MPKTTRKTKISSKPIARKKTFPIVAFGASAGGLEAITAILKELSATTGMAYFYLQHQDPNHKSQLVEILSRHTKMKVVQAKNRLRAKINHLFIIPPNRTATLKDGVIVLKSRPTEPGPPTLIDRFFESLAENHKYATIGILLSGNGADGTIGMKAIKVAGGLTMVQDKTAKFQSMPQSAIGDDVVDMVLPPNKIARELIHISSNKDFVRKIFNYTEHLEQIDKEEINVILNLLKKATGADFHDYKITTIHRRIIRRMLLHKLATLKEYIQYIHHHKTEIHALHNDLLINVTTFFRDPDGLEYLQKSVLPKIIKSKSKGQPIRIWIPACATGEEAYSLAISLDELLEPATSEIAVQIFATDLSDIAISKARIGLFSKADINSVSEKRLNDYFTKIDGSYRVIKRIRDNCVFSQHNVFRDPPFSRMDLISCCNLMIYLGPSLQKKLLHLFHYSLNQNGYLIVGKSESIEAASELFLQVENKFKVFSKKNKASNRARFELRFPTKDKRATSKINLAPQKSLSLKENVLDKAVDKILLNRFTPASVLINEDLDILQFRGSPDLFFEPSPGKASLNLLKMSRSGLAYELKKAVSKSSRSQSIVKKEGIEVKRKGRTQDVSIEIFPVTHNGEGNLFLVTFIESKLPSKIQRTSNVKQTKTVRGLKDEIKVLKDDLFGMINERDTNLEELQTANEEIISSNEELQSINEELETSKEELESSTEELSTINGELQARNDQLSEAHEYSAALFDIIGEAVLVLTRDFRVKHANKPFYQFFGVTKKETEGKLIFELGNRQWDIHPLRNALEGILGDHRSIENFEVEHTFQKIGTKVMRINATALTRGSNEQLILVAVEDITEERQKQKLLAERETWFRNMANQAPVMIWVSDLDRGKQFFNDTWLKFTGKKISEEKGVGWRNQIHIDDIQPYMETFDNGYRTHRLFVHEYRLKKSNGDHRWILEIGKPIFDETNSFSGFIGSCTEIHDRKVYTEALEERVNERTQALLELNNELEHSNIELQQFAYVASHDLQEPLRKSLIYADRLQNLKHPLPASASLYVNKIIQSSDRMRKLIDGLLDFSRLSGPKQKHEEIDLQALIQNLLSDFEIIINETNAEIKFQNLPVIQAVQIQMEQLFHNLISNALKFSKPNESPYIEITFRSLKKKEIIGMELNPSQRYVNIIVSDRGIGFNENYKEKIFEIFLRLQSTKDYAGSGIGLALCRRIVNNHGGKIFAKSIENIGTEFHIILPAI